MPELPEVETMVRGIRPHVAGRLLLETEFCPCTRRPILVSPAPHLMRRRLSGCIIRDVQRLAKRVVIEVSDDGRSTRKRVSSEFLVIEPRMTGLMLIADAPTQEHRRICWHLKPSRGKPSSFEFWDRRGLGTVRLLNETEFAELTRRLGPDALTMTVPLWQQQLGTTSRAVKVALLDQQRVSGIGNLYASEILHRAGVSPQTPSCRLTRRHWQGIAEATEHILREAIRYEGSTLSDGAYRNALNKSGGYQNAHRVYDREGELCPTCRRSRIRRIVQSQRSTFFCPTCQRCRRW
ncbi:MAG: formamidopyrimidine-DNA glycosylase [Planctomycetaceae bacterium]|nr:formamidopyrimidine-DNA glycosylase [Planctomycetaceae bacterium]